MYDNWTEVRSQMEQVLENERLQRQARRQPRSFGQVCRQWWYAILNAALESRRSPSRVALHLPQQR
jgi:hypothetical protein